MQCISLLELADLHTSLASISFLSGDDGAAILHKQSVAFLYDAHEFMIFRLHPFEWPRQCLGSLVGRKRMLSDDLIINRLS